MREEENRLEILTWYGEESDKRNEVTKVHELGDAYQKAVVRGKGGGVKGGLVIES